jgi:hypothetical protein
MTAQVPAALLACSALVLLAGCGSTTSSAPPAAAVSGPAADSASTTDTPTDDGTAPAPGIVEVCKVLPAATVAGLTGVAFTTAVVGHTGWDSECGYSNDDSSAQLQVKLTSQNVDSTWQAVDGAGVTDVPALGDKAIWDNDSTLYVVKGDVLMQVNGLDKEAAAVAVAQQMTGLLP